MPKAKVVKHKQKNIVVRQQVFLATCSCKWKDDLEVIGESNLSVALATLDARYKEHYAG